MKEAFEKIFAVHARSLANLGFSNPRVVICFAGIPGSGKTTLAEKIEEKYKGVRVSTKEIGKIIDKLVVSEQIKAEDKHELQTKYQLWLLDNWNYKNCFFILDSGIERKYERVLEVVKEKGYGLFVIRLDVDEKVLRERINKRDGKNAKNYFREFDRWKREFGKFKEGVEVDFVFTGDNEEALFQELDKRLGKVFK